MIGQSNVLKMHLEFEKAFIELIGVEGGYVNDPTDRGGETKYGISKRSYPKLNIKQLTLDDAKQIYYNDFWLKYDVDWFAKEYRFLVFDMLVNHGPKGTGLILQRSVNNKCGFKKLKIDGAFGRRSKQAFKTKTPELNRVLAYRAKYFVDIVRRNPSQEKYLYGWLNHRVFKIAE